MGKREKSRNRHHLIGRENKDYFNVEEENNIKWMQLNKHRALHTLFQPANTPREQLEVMEQLFETILSEKAKQIFKTLTSMDDTDFYQDGLVK